ncbi:uncharacterized protein LOC110690347 [Chenopodium quinoa]|uniref:uncharacterized protein LOC110690347 n=1 Tax=Chenopodium quinoa TaxID=63459 RepID=UPI000B78A761|nr:uncharacterized protein LOC110690347 [Chenopodium quinoa]
MFIINLLDIKETNKERIPSLHVGFMEIASKSISKELNGRPNFHFPLLGSAVDEFQCPFSLGDLWVCLKGYFDEILEAQVNLGMDRRRINLVGVAAARCCCYARCCCDQCPKFSNLCSIIH